MNADLMKEKYAGLLYAGLLSAIIVNALLALVLVAMQRSQIAHEKLFFWLILLGVVLLARAGLLVAWRRNARLVAPSDPKWLRRFRIGVIATGTVWGISAVLLFPENDMLHQVFLAFILAGLAAGAIPSLAVDIVSTLGFLVPMLLPLVLRFVFEGGELALSMGGSIALFLFFVAINSTRIGHNIRESIRLRTEAEQAHSQMEQAQHIAHAGSFEWDPLSGALQWSVEHFRLWGLKPYASTPTFELFRGGIHPEDVVRVENSLQCVLQGGRFYDCEHRVVWPDGSMHFIHGRGEVVFDDRGQPVKMNGTVQDISDRMRAESALRTLNERLEKKVADKLAELREKDHMLIEQARLASMGEMINNIAHQWRQPLSVVGLTFQNMEIDFKEGMLDGQIMHEYVRNGISVVDKMSSTIDDFRDFFHAKRGEREFDLHKSLMKTVELMELSLIHHGIALRCDEEVRVVVRGYPNEFSQILLNLLSNAKDVLIERKIHSATIEIATRYEKGNAVIKVSDNGGGIPDEIIGKLFDPYFTTKASGTGIGLYMSKMIIKKMGGTIEARNAGEGSEFILTLPAAHNKEM